MATTKDSILRLERKVDKGFSDMKTYVDRKVQPIHDFMKEEQGYNRGRKDSGKNGAISLDPRIADLLKWLVLIIGTIVGARLI